MPKRTNEKQAIVALLRRNLAGPGWTVTESKIFFDSRTKRPREVDVVVEIPAGDLPPHVVSFEVLAKDRPADVNWVQLQQKRHETLPTTRLVLVSWSGFTDGALAQAETEPKLRLVTPTIVRDSTGAPVNLTVDVTRRIFTAGKVVLSVQVPGAGVVRVTTDASANPSLGLHDSTGAKIGTVRERAELYLARPAFFDRVASEQRERPGPKWFRIHKDMQDEEAFLFDRTKQQLQRVVGLEVWGVASWEHNKVDI